MKRKIWLLAIVNILLLIYLLLFTFLVRPMNAHTLWLMYILELLSTLCFSFRIGFTARDKFLIAAIIGCIGGVVAGAQGLLLITEDLGFSKGANFGLKLPSVLIATFTGIYLNGIYKDINGGKNDLRRK